MKKYRIPIICIVILITCWVFAQPPIQPILNFFLDLEDTPSDYTGEDGKIVKVDEANNQLIFEVESGAVEDDVYGAGWNGDTTNAPSQNAVYDQIHLYDTDDDGDIDVVDGGVGGGDITGVGPGALAAGDALTDGYVTTGTTLFIWEGTTDDGAEFSIIVPEDPGADIVITMPTATATLNAAGDITGTDAGTDLTADLEEEVTEGSLADSTIISADIKDGEVALVDLAAAAYAKDLVATSPLTVNAGANVDNILIGADGDVTIAITDADDDGVTKGAASFDNTDFDAVGGNVTIVDDGHAHTGASVTGLGDAQVDNNITIDLATVATTVTITDNESTNENNPIVFVAGADPDGGNLGLETDGNAHYNPSTGTITATEFAGGGAALTDVGISAATNLTLTVRAAENVYKGQAVYVSGSTGAAFPNVNLADADDAAKIRVIGVAAEDIANTSTGLVRISGLLTNVDTFNEEYINPDDEDWDAGQLLYLHTTPGNLTETPPTTGRVIRVAHSLYGDSNTDAFVIHAHVSPINITAAPTEDVKIRVGDNAGANKVTIVDNDDAEVAKIDSDGLITAVGFSGGGASLTSVDATTGDSATAFFDAGTIEHERGGIEADISGIADGGVLVGTGVGTMGIRASFLTAGAAGFIKHELGGLEADINAYTGLVAISGGSTAEIDSKNELEGQIADVSDFAEADGDTFTGTHDFSGATVTMPKRTKNDDRFYAFNAWNPNSLYDTDTQLCFEPNLPANITITEVTITLDADPATELDWDLKWADTFIGMANATLIVAIDTTNGTTDIDSGFNDATVAMGKCIYLEFAADPDSNIKQAMVKIRYDFD